MLNGYKTYLSAGALFAFAVYGLVSGHLTSEVALPLIFNAMALAGLRAAK
jgi:hypothetical protein